MAGHQLKSTAVTNLDAFPIIENTIGEMAPGMLQVNVDVVSPITGDDTTSTYRLCRFPTRAKVKQVWISSTIAGAGNADIDVAFSDSTSDGTYQPLAGGVVQISGPVDNKLFGAARSLVAVPRTDVTFANGYNSLMQQMPFWMALTTLGATQFTTDPGGYFDIFLKVTTSITTGGNFAAEIYYVM